MISVITGSEGFIGKTLTRELLKLGHTVRCLDLTHEQTESIDPKIDKIKIDCCDEDSLANSPALDNADYIFHLAAVTKEISLDGFRRVNVRPVQTLLDAVELRNIQLKRFVFISTQAVARPTGDPFSPQHETDATEPVEFYGKSKMEAEQLVHSYGDRIPFTIIRPSSVYGPGDRDFLKLFKMMNKRLNIFHGNQNQYISIVHVDDLVNGIIRAAFSEKTECKTYFLASREITTWNQVHNLINKQCGKNAFNVNIPIPFVSFLAKAGDLTAKITGKPTILNSQKISLSKAPGWICCSKRARRDFGFTTNFTLSDGIEMTGKWYQDEGWL